MNSRWFPELVGDAAEVDYRIMRRCMYTPFKVDAPFEHWIRASWGLNFEEFCETFDLTPIEF